MMWGIAYVVLGMLLLLVTAGALTVRSVRKANRQLKEMMQPVVEEAERSNRYEFYRWALDGPSFLLLYGENPEIIEREVGPDNYKALLRGWGVLPTIPRPQMNPELWRDLPEDLTG